MAQDYRFGESITLQLKRDEAIVLFWYLTRELWGDSPKLRASFIHPAEEHSLEELLQELVVPLMDTGAPGASGIENAAREHLLKRFT